MTDVETTHPWDGVATRVRQGARLVGVFGTAVAGSADETVITAVLAEPGGIDLVDLAVGGEYPSLTPLVPAAFWYERVLHDHFSTLPLGHPRPEPLVLPGMHGPDGEPTRPPRPGASEPDGPRLVPSETALARHLRGAGLFTIPHGPVRSGVTESIEYLVETPGEDIPLVQIRVFAKHRGVELAFEGRPATEGVLLAERVEGTASVAHASAYCQALERLGGVTIPEPAALVRMLHAELERIVGHLEVAARLCEAAALSVGIARLTQHKEDLQRIRHQLCGSRFGRDVVIPGGVVPPVAAALTNPHDLQIGRVRQRIERDRDLLMVTSSFLDRLRGTGVLAPERAALMGAVGPVGRASGVTGDVRWDLPYDAYQGVARPETGLRRTTHDDVQARLEVRWEEIETSFELIEHALEALLVGPQAGNWSVPVPPVTGRATGLVEGPQGETAYVVAVEDGVLRRVWPRTASFHNLLLFRDVFHSDVLTDFPFIEASFAISNAGVVM